MKEEKSDNADEGKQKTSFMRDIIFCPVCKSTNIIRRMAPVGIPNVVALGQMNVCKDCGFQDKIFPEIGEDDINKLEKLKKFFKKKKNK